MGKYLLKNTITGPIMSGLRLPIDAIYEKGIIVLNVQNLEFIGEDGLEHHIVVYIFMYKDDRGNTCYAVLTKEDFEYLFEPAYE